MGCSDCSFREGSACTASVPQSVRIFERTSVSDGDGEGCPSFSQRGKREQARARRSSVKNQEFPPGDPEELRQGITRILREDGDAARAASRKLADGYLRLSQEIGETARYLADLLKGVDNERESSR